MAALAMGPGFEGAHSVGPPGLERVTGSSAPEEDSSARLPIYSGLGDLWVASYEEVGWARPCGRM
jgi:hypothetical protein